MNTKLCYPPLFNTSSDQFQQRVKRILIEKWENSGLLAGLDDDERKLHTALILDNQQEFFLYLSYLYLFIVISLVFVSKYKSDKM